MLPGIAYGGNGHWSIIDAQDNMILYQNYQFQGDSDKSGLIIVGDEDKCPDVLLPGPNATVDTLLVSTEGYPVGETSLGYRNLCNNVQITISNSSSPTGEYTEMEDQSELSAGVYEFFTVGGHDDGKLKTVFAEHNRSACKV
jgi:hypothetical protein